MRQLSGKMDIKRFSQASALKKSKDWMAILF
jgi:hypothetical protein